MVVVHRLLGILFSLAPFARGTAKIFGLGSMLQRHSEWVSRATGFMEVDSGKYLSDRLASFGFREGIVISKFQMAETTTNVKEGFEWSIISITVFCFWRFL